jgi:hypothetical protein
VSPSADTSRLPLPELASIEGRRVEVRGVVETVVGRTVIVRQNDGQVFAVDMSELRGNSSESIGPGTTVTVFGDQLETWFRARGVIYDDPPATPKRTERGGPRKPTR